MSDFDAAMDALAQRFLARCEGELPKLRAFLTSPSDDRGELHHIVHRMSGSAGIFGHTVIGALAAQVDNELSLGRPAEATSLAALAEALDALLAESSPKQS